MKRANSLLVLILSLAIVAESRGQRQIVNNDVITVDVRKSYSSKKELILQDFMDVEYIALETNDDFLNQGYVEDIGKEIIIVGNRIDINDGDIFVYDRTGKALRKINRKGQGGEEYTYMMSITLDEENDEIFVSDIMTRKIIVYDLYGKYKRSFKPKEGTLSYNVVFNYDRDNLICYDRFNKETPFFLVSKQDGSITKEIKIPFKEKILLRAINSEGLMRAPGEHRSIIPFQGKWLLLEQSADTVYTFLPDYSLLPIIVRTPPIQSMNPEVILNLRLLSERYYFMETVKNEFNFSTGTGFPKTHMMYDAKEKAFGGYIIYNGDYSSKKEIYLSMGRPVNHEIESWYLLEAYQLVESYKKGELKEGKLKEIAATLDPEDNPVIMLIKHKK